MTLREEIARTIHEDRDSWRKPQERRAWDNASHGDKTVALSHADAILALPAIAEGQELRRTLHDGPGGVVPVIRETPETGGQSSQ